MTSHETRTRKLFQATGAWTAIVTPFTDDGAEVDYDALDALVDEQVKCGVDAVVPCGTTGEAPTLTDEERDLVVQRVVKRAAGRVSVVAGTGTYSTAETLRATARAAECGADAAMIVVPYYNRPSQRMLFEHFKVLAERCLTPIVIYNIPSRTGVNLEVETTAELRRRYRHAVVGIKEASGAVENAMRLRAMSDIPILSGDDALTLPMMSVGAGGVVSVAGNVAPKIVAHLVRSMADGDLSAARTAHERLMPLVKALFREPNPVPVKCALKVLGRGNGVVRAPLLAALPDTEGALRDALGALALLPGR